LLTSDGDLQVTTRWPVHVTQGMILHITYAFVAADAPSRGETFLRPTRAGLVGPMPDIRSTCGFTQMNGPIRNNDLPVDPLTNWDDDVAYGSIPEHLRPAGSEERRWILPLWTDNSPEMWLDGIRLTPSPTNTGHLVSWEREALFIASSNQPWRTFANQGWISNSAEPPVSLPIPIPTSPPPPDPDRSTANRLPGGNLAVTVAPGGGVAELHGTFNVPRGGVSFGWIFAGHLPPGARPASEEHFVANAWTVAGDARRGAHVAIRPDGDIRVQWRHNMATDYVHVAHTFLVADEPREALPEVYFPPLEPLPIIQLPFTGGEGGNRALLGLLLLAVAALFRPVKAQAETR
jgi:hypothetical protein